MKKVNLIPFICAVLFAGGIALWAAQIAVPTPEAFSDQLPPGIIAQFRNAVVEGAQKANVSVMSEDDSNRLLAEMKGRNEEGQVNVLRAARADGMLFVRIERNIGGFMLQVEPRACSDKLGFSRSPFAIQVGQFQNLPHCLPELTARLCSDAADTEGPVMVLLMPRIKDPQAPLFLKNYLNNYLENLLVTRGYRSCAGRVVEDALRSIRLGGFFEVTPERCRQLGNTLLVDNGSIVEITIDSYVLQTVNDTQNGRVFQISFKGALREFSVSSGELTFEKRFELKQFKASDQRAAELNPTLRNNASAFVQFAIELALNEQLLTTWPPPTKK